MGERLNGIQEVSGSIPLVSIPVRFVWQCVVTAARGHWVRWKIAEALRE